MTLPLCATRSEDKSWKPPLRTILRGELRLLYAYSAVFTQYVGRALRTRMMVREFERVAVMAKEVDAEFLRVP